MEDNLSKTSFSLEVPVQQVPTSLADKESVKPIADDAMENSFDEVDYDEDVGDITPEIDTSKVPTYEHKDQKVISAVHKLCPKMDSKPSDLNNIEEYLQRFERIFKDNNLTTEQTKHLLRLFAHNNESVAQCLTRHNELNPLCTWEILKNDILKEFLSPYWRSEKYSKIFKIDYYHGETVSEFIGRFQDP
ncbi:hypothetical protein ROZALSC1DRAFT_25183 [Rozella allomycis CSF55]|uniref:Retrotransposon gag domain-containing protein n=1 Tax=Rozella allomycis (strain CSF55) TaxID=988480 RepID=A0A4P9YBB1_ROZAC|nr:hypothetical protein ROZALSC1DRAFT_25183 [Rozella allomycis CSF55]